MKKSKYRLYEKDERRWVQYDEETYKEIKRWRNSFCALQRYKQACFCPKKEQWKCNTICVTCPYRKAEISFNQPIYGTKNLTIGDSLTDELNLGEQCVASSDTKKILLRLDELMPEAKEIGRLRIQGKSEIEIAKILNIPRATIYTRIKVVEKKLVEEFGEF